MALEKPWQESPLLASSLGGHGLLWSAKTARCKSWVCVWWGLGARGDTQAETKAGRLSVTCGGP